jgi:hypothetical protein
MNEINSNKNKVCNAESQLDKVSTASVSRLDN